jgi:SRSO17 transposase
MLQWGLPIEEIRDLGNHFYQFVEPYRICMMTKTHNTSNYGVKYVNGLLRMETERNMANIARKTEVDDQRMQHFMSNSPWSGPKLIQRIQEDIRMHPEFTTGAMLILDESAEQKAGDSSSGAGRQYNGRLGKIEMSQVGVFLTLATPRVNTWIDGELFIPERWFGEEYAEQRRQVGVPAERTFQTKPELGWLMIQRAIDSGIPFDAVAMDDLYGRNRQLCRRLDKANIEYYGDVPANTTIYLDKPTIKHCKKKNGQLAKKYEIVGTSYRVRDLGHHEHLERAKLTLRSTERGLLQATFARCRVWVVDQGRCQERWLLIRQDNKRVTYVLSNAHPEISLETMAWRKSHRYFVERSNQDAKGELGWDEFQAIKYRAWEHQLALTILASWFIADTRLDWMSRYERDPELLAHYETDVLPLLSVGNVRELLQAAMPLPQLSPEEATQLVIEKLINRTRSRKSRLRKAQKTQKNERVPET